ncbi:MAG: 50S ribosomal protein L30 [Acidimicrobiia bacterium]|nr:MAG: 50S ribosomal protein L30 [Acidimicrobiia bacterium]
MADRLKITLRRSLIGQKPKTRATVRSLGLKKIHQTVSHPDTPAVRGMIHKVAHLVEVEEEAPGKTRSIHHG